MDHGEGELSTVRSADEHRMALGLALTGCRRHAAGTLRAVSDLVGAVERGELGTEDLRRLEEDLRAQAAEAYSVAEYEQVDAFLGALFGGTLCWSR